MYLLFIALLVIAGPVLTIKTILERRRYKRALLNGQRLEGQVVEYLGRPTKSMYVRYRVRLQVQGMTRLYVVRSNEMKRQMAPETPVALIFLDEGKGFAFLEGQHELPLTDFTTIFFGMISCAMGIAALVALVSGN
jgi:hypothetical protein